MNRTDRLLAIVLELQRKKVVRAEDLAALFEVTKRTIYRDILALDEAGVPIISTPGVGYSLIEGYFLPPVTFNVDEAIMLLLGADFISHQFDSHYRRAAQLARHKIISVLPKSIQADVDYLKSSIHFFTISEFSKPEILQTIRHAIIRHRTVRLIYQSTERAVDPYALIYIQNTWILIAYCHLREDRRHFRLDRMQSATLLDQSFTRPADFEIQHEDDRTMEVRAIFDHQVMQQVQESPSGYQVSQEDHPDGLLITFRVRHPRDLMRWLLGWGSHFKVIEPQSLRELLAIESEAIFQNHKNLLT